MRSSYLAFGLLLLLLSSIHSQPLTPPLSPGEKVIGIAESFAGTKEATGNNDGAAVEMFLHSVGLKKGTSWCGAFVSYCLTKAEVKEPKIRSGLARHFKKGKNLILANEVLRGAKSVPIGSLVGWEKGNTIYGHIGFVKTWKQQTGVTIEGNTSSGVSGSQSNGDGVYVRSRSIQPANYFRIMWFVPVE